MKRYAMNAKPILLLCSFLSFNLMTFAQTIPSSARSRKAVENVLPELQKRFTQANLESGAPVFMRIFKHTDELEVWVKKDTLYQLFQTYEICDYSGGLGTKKREGDKKSPEGFYTVKPIQLNPHSAFHLSFNIGYPNKLERQLGYTGSAIMVHGDCVSIGCYAMTDKNIEEIWTIMVKAFENGQEVIPLHIFPFRLTAANLRKMQHKKDYNLWKDMQPAFDYFEQKRQLPEIGVSNKHYQIVP
jgi:murein L,D-transpeptidase YafK